ncbi:hypothetical protein A3K62_00695 [Candidatus Pacearchaeota archaeon RBG_16_35_8]|nr:MAG: hypothetical protein A3K62_00695 [Candidatus Pacearchaeota archaeon RBG_16_35_8]
MKKREFQDKKRYLWAFIIGTVLFLLVFLLTYFISYIEFQRVSNTQTNLAYNIFSHKLSYTFFEDKVCDESAYEQLTNDFNFQRAIISDLERKMGKDSKIVIERKKFYTLIELEHFEFIQKLNSECKREFDTILFFYSNEENDLQKSEDAGRLLDTLFLRNTENLIIYSFDINLDTSLIDDLKKRYNITSSPAIVINGNNTLVNPANIIEIEKFL